MNIAVLFDWDGVVIDSSAMHKKSWELLAEEEKRVLPEDHFKKGFGRKNQIIIPCILKWTEDTEEIRRLSDRKEALYRKFVQQENISPLPGIRQLLNELKEANLPRAIASSTPRINLDAVLSSLGMENDFQAILSGDDVGAGKPDPEVFLKAASALQTPPERCLVIEDAHFGIEAAKRAGMKVLAVATTHPVDELHEAHLAVDSLESIDLAALRTLFASESLTP